MAQRAIRINHVPSIAIQTWPDGPWLVRCDGYVGRLNRMPSRFTWEWLE